MKDIIEVISNKKDTHLRIEYMVGNYCNYKCWYCGPHANGGTHRWFNDTSLLIDNFNYLFDYFSRNGKQTFELSLVGGEPSLWPDLINFITKLKKDNPVYVSMITNGSRSLRWWDENAKFFDKIRFSCHVEQVDIDHFINVCDLVYEKNVTMNTLIMMDPTRWEECVELIHKCKKSKHSWFINAVEVFSQHTYTNDQKKFIEKSIKRYPNIFWILKHENIFSNSPKIVFSDGKVKKINTNFLSLNNYNKFKGWECNLGKDNINIQKDGILTGVCGMKLYGESFYYDIYDKDFQKKFNPQLKPVICERETCYCQPEQLLNKKKITNEHVLSKVYPLRKYNNL